MATFSAFFSWFSCFWILARRFFKNRDLPRSNRKHFRMLLVSTKVLLPHFRWSASLKFILPINCTSIAVWHEREKNQILAWPLSQPFFICFSSFWILAWHFTRRAVFLGEVVSKILMLFVYFIFSISHITGIGNKLWSVEFEERELTLSTTGDKDCSTVTSGIANTALIHFCPTL